MWLTLSRTDQSLGPDSRHHACRRRDGGAPEPLLISRAAVPATIVVAPRAVRAARAGAATADSQGEGYPPDVDRPVT